MQYRYNDMSTLVESSGQPGIETLIHLWWCFRRQVRDHAENTMKAIWFPN